jgi:hypothetical protein
LFVNHECAADGEFDCTNENLRIGEELTLEYGQEKSGLSSVTAVTDRSPDIRETSIVNMVQGTSKKVLLEPGDTRQQWKGEAATSFVN